MENFKNYLEGIRSQGKYPQKPFNKMSDNELKLYLSKITDKALYSYNVYQIEGEGKNLFSKINGDKDTIMGLPIKKIKEYLDNCK